VLSVALVWACASEPARVIRLPGAETPSVVTRVDQRGPFLDATLGDWRFFFHDEPTCQAVLELGAQVSYHDSGPLGSVDSEAGACEPIGVGSLEAWRSLRGRGMDDKPKPRAQTVSREMYRDKDVVLLRGRFPLASRARMRGDDIVAVLDADDACVPKISSSEQTGTMEYKQSGRPPFRLFLGGESCTIVGFIKPFGLAAS
jgi:hypothetical protein